MYPQTVEPLVSPVVQQAASELLAAIDPRNLPELRYDDAGNIDWDATISTLSMFPALHACALTVQGACAVGIQGSGYMPGMGGRSSFDIWVTTSGEIVTTISGGGGAYVSPNLGGGGGEFSVTALPGAVLYDLDEWAVQVGGSGAFGGGVGGEFVILQTDSGKTLVGLSTSLALGKAGIEGHATFTHTWLFRQKTYVPRSR